MKRLKLSPTNWRSKCDRNNYINATSVSFSYRDHASITDTDILKNSTMSVPLRRRRWQSSSQVQAKFEQFGQGEREVGFSTWQKKYFLSLFQNVQFSWFQTCYHPKKKVYWHTMTKSLFPKVDNIAICVVAGGCPIQRPTSNTNVTTHKQKNGFFILCARIVQHEFRRSYLILLHNLLLLLSVISNLKIPFFCYLCMLLECSY